MNIESKLAFNIKNELYSVELSCHNMSFDILDTVYSEKNKRNYWIEATEDQLSKLRYDVQLDIKVVSSLYGYDNAIKLLNLIEAERPDIYHYLELEDFKTYQLR